jgi:hypothetical protein
MYGARHCGLLAKKKLLIGKFGEFFKNKIELIAKKLGKIVLLLKNLESQKLLTGLVIFFFF